MPNPILLPVAPDDAKRLRELIEVGFESDLLLLSGGVSMGKYDLVEQVLCEMRAEFFLPARKSNPENLSFSDWYREPKTTNTSLDCRVIQFRRWSHSIYLQSQ